MAMRVCFRFLDKADPSNTFNRCVILGDAAEEQDMFNAADEAFREMTPTDLADSGKVKKQASQYSLSIISVGPG